MEKHEQGFNINMPTAVIVAGFLIAVAIYASGASTGSVGSVAQQAPAPTQAPGQGAGGPPPTKDVTVNPISNKDHYYGSQNAKVVLIEFSDLECPFCKRFHPTVKEIVDNSNGKVAWVYRHFPLDFHDKAKKEAEASECAAELGGNDKFWEYVNTLYEITPGNNGLDPAELPKIATKVGLDATSFQKCLDSGKYAERVKSDMADGAKAGVSGTPSTVIMNRKGKNQLIVGAQPKEQIQAAIDELLK